MRQCATTIGASKGLSLPSARKVKLKQKTAAFDAYSSGRMNWLITCARELARVQFAGRVAAGRGRASGRREPCGQRHGRKIFPHGAPRRTSPSCAAPGRPGASLLGCSPVGLHQRGAAARLRQCPSALACLRSALLHGPHGRDAPLRVAATLAAGPGLRCSAGKAVPEHLEQARCVESRAAPELRHVVL